VIVLGLLLTLAMSKILLESGTNQKLFSLTNSSALIVQLLLFIALPLSILIYLGIDYLSHRQPLVQGIPMIRRDYSFAHHVRVVNAPLFFYRFKDSFATVAISLVYLVGFSGFLGYMIVRDSNAAPGMLSVTIDQKAGTADPNPSYTSVFTVVFSEAIDKSSFTAADLTLGGTAPGQAVQSITEAGTFDQTTFEVRIQATAAGTIQPSITAESVTALNPASGTNNLSTSTDNQVTYDGSYSPGEFIVRVKTDNPGVSSSTQFTIPAASGAGNNYNVDCTNDGAIDYSNQTSSTTCNYASAGEYDIAVTGALRNWDGYTHDNPIGKDQGKIVDVKQWGSMQWWSMRSMFYDAVNLVVSGSQYTEHTPELN
ncbi:hypothetical protein KDA11_06845, partial [Candidatus Saccharibacteria bacterium]|nr:hypothetical protein [Candidatus Saccharibacteria bacterium]